MKTQTIILDWKDLSSDAFDEFKEAFSKIGYHLGDAEQEYYGRSMSDSYLLYVSKKKLTKKQLEKLWNLFNGMSPE